jgi:GDP-L-fucose synthase
MNKDAKIYIAGHQGMVGSSIHRLLLSEGYNNIVIRSSKELDLRVQTDVSRFFEQEKPEYVFLAAAKVGGILANATYPATFLYDNVMIEFNVMQAAYENKVKKLLFLGSSCIYPKFANQPLKESELLSGYLEETNQSYALAKIVGIQFCNDYRKQYGVDFISLMPTNLYGQHDNFDAKSSHVLPALIDRFHHAKEHGDEEVVVWGTGSPLREFLFVDDLASASLFVMKHYSESGHINIGSGEEVSIKELAELISKVIGYEGAIVFDHTKPDGTPRKLLDVSKATALGWTASTSLKTGIEKTYEWYLNHGSQLRRVQ